MAKTRGNPNTKPFRYGAVTCKFSLHTGNVTWLPRDGASKLTKKERQDLCSRVKAEADAWDLLFPPHYSEEEKMVATYTHLFGGVKSCQ